MDPLALQDVLYRGLGRAGRAVGRWCEAFRPTDGQDPVAPRNLVLRLPAGFAPADGRFGRAQGPGQVFWQGLFDAAYTRPGDYLVQRESRRGMADGGVWFIAAQQPLLPVLCVRASRVVDVIRPPAPDRPGIGSYGGIGDAVEQVLLRRWPAGVLAGPPSRAGAGSLPDEAGGLGWTLLLPSLGGVVLRAGDTVRDDLGRRGVIVAADLSELGWRLRVRVAGA